MTRLRLFSAGLFAAFCLGLGAALLPGAAAPAMAADGYAVPVDYDSQAMRRVSIGMDKSVIIELPVDAKDVLVSSPRIADAVMRSTRKAFLIGIEVGHTNVFFFDGAGRTILALDVTVERDIGALETTLARLLPEASISVEGVADSVVLRGEVTDAETAGKAADIAARFVADAEKVVNLLAIRGGDQVLLKVTVAEMQRNVVKQLGIDIQSSTLQIGNLALGASTSNPFSVAGSALGGLGLRAQQADLSGNSVDALLRALEQNGVLRTLAEPTLTAISGEAASFQAGGEFPVITGVDRDTGAPTVEFKPFGVGLGFTPVVLSGGRISLKVNTEVSELTNEGAVNLPTPQGQAITVPALQVRRADTTVELPSGGSIAIAGLIKDDIRQSINGVPGLMRLPVIGSLFRSRDYRRGQTELVVIVTPFLARHTHREELARPDDGYETATDPEAVLLGRLNRRYGANHGSASGYRGSHGFIID